MEQENVNRGKDSTGTPPLSPSHSFSDVDLPSLY